MKRCGPAARAPSWKSRRSRGELDSLRSTGALLKLPNLDIPHPRLVAVVSQHDVTGDLFAEGGLGLEFALLDPGFHLRAAEFVGHGQLAVVPVLNLLAADDDFRGVPFARRL